MCPPCIFHQPPKVRHKKIKQRRRAPSMWCLFLREKTLGMVGTPSIAELSRDYQLAKMDGHLEALALDSRAKVYKKVAK
eukprot:5707585-Amphidinium_carterae.1